MNRLDLSFSHRIISFTTTGSFCWVVVERLDTDKPFRFITAQCKEPPAGKKIPVVLAGQHASESAAVADLYGRFSRFQKLREAA